MKYRLAQALGLLLLSACSLDAAPPSGSDPEAPIYPPWRPSKPGSPDAAAAGRGGEEVAGSGGESGRAAPSAGKGIDHSPSRAVAAAGSGGQASNKPSEPSAVAAAGSGGRASDKPSEPSAMPAAGSGGTTPASTPMAGMPATEPAAGSGDPEPPHAASAAGASAEPASTEPPNTAPPASEPPPPPQLPNGNSVDVPNMQPATAAEPSLVGGILELLYGVLSPLPAVAELLVSVIGLSVTSDTPDTLTQVLNQLDGSLACQKNPSDCEAACALLATDCRACDGDEACLDAIARVCGHAATRDCRGQAGRGRNR